MFYFQGPDWTGPYLSKFSKGGPNNEKKLKNET